MNASTATKNAPVARKARATSANPRKSSKASKDMNNEPMVKRATPARKPRSKVAVTEVKAPVEKKAPVTQRKAKAAPQIENDNKLTPAQMPDPVPSMTKAAKPAAAEGARRWATGPKQNHSEIEGPCAHVHWLYFEALTNAGGVDNIVRKDVLDKAIADGVDPHTAKTQFQRARAWAMQGNTSPKPRKQRKPKADKAGQAVDLQSEADEGGEEA